MARAGSPSKEVSTTKCSDSSPLRTKPANAVSSSTIRIRISHSTCYVRIFSLSEQESAHECGYRSRAAPFWPGEARFFRLQSIKNPDSYECDRSHKKL